MVDDEETSSPWGRSDRRGQASGVQRTELRVFVDRLSIRESRRFGGMVGSDLVRGFWWSLDDFGTKGAMALAMCVLKWWWLYVFRNCSGYMCTLLSC